MNYLKKFDELKNKLEDNSLIDIHHFQMEDGLSDANIKMVEDEVHIILPNIIKEFYRQVSSLDFLWTLKEDAEIQLLSNDESGNVNGKAYIPDLYTVFAGRNDDPENPWKNVFWFEDSMDKDMLEENKKIRPFDWFDNHKGECVCFLKDDSKLKDKLYLRNENGKIFPIGLNLADYIELLVRTGGFVNFQFAYTAKNGSESEKLKHYVPKIFPGTSLDKLE